MASGGLPPQMMVCVRVVCGLREHGWCAVVVGSIGMNVYMWCNGCVRSEAGVCAVFPTRAIVTAVVVFVLSSLFVVCCVLPLSCLSLSLSLSSKQRPGIILLKEGTDTSQGKPQLISNINACQSIVDAVRTTLGPRGMDKLIVDDRGNATISNDGATIMKLLDVVHPAGRTLVDIAKSQDAEVCI